MRGVRSEVAVIVVKIIELNLTENEGSIFLKYYHLKAITATIKIYGTHYSIRM